MEGFVIYYFRFITYCLGKIETLKKSISLSLFKFTNVLFAYLFNKFKMFIYKGNDRVEFLSQLTRKILILKINRFANTNVFSLFHKVLFIIKYFTDMTFPVHNVNNIFLPS